MARSDFTHKMVDGKRVDLTEEEEMAIRVAISIGYTKLSDEISILQEQLNELEAQMPCY